MFATFRHRLTAAAAALMALGLAGCSGPSSSGGGPRQSPSLTTIALPERSAIVPAAPDLAPQPAPSTAIQPSKPPSNASLFPPPTPTAPAPSSQPGIPTAPATAAPGTGMGTAPTRPSAIVSPSLSLLNGHPWPAAWSNVWVPFETWSRMNGLGSPVQTASGPDTTFTVGTPQGMLRIKPGNQAARMLGTDTLLGYAPRLVGGIPYIHSLDLQKTLQPLLSGSLQMANTNRVIVLDPGHGGRDSGTRNMFGGENEKHFTLDWARRLERLLTADGWTVLLTRTNDVDVALADRVTMADRANADLFLSLHFNAGRPNTEMNGIETYCLTPTGLPSSLRRDFEDDPRESLPNNAHDQANLLVANRLHRALVTATGAADRGVRRARFMTVLRGQNRPAVLIEGGYLSNAMESRRVGTPAYRQSLAEAVAGALKDLVQPTPVAPGPGTDAGSTAAARLPAPTPASQIQNLPAAAPSTNGLPTSTSTSIGPASAPAAPSPNPNSGSP